MQNSSSQFLTQTLTSSEEEQQEAAEKAKSAYGKLKLPKDYNRLAIPITVDKTVYVYISLFVRTIQEINEQNEVCENEIHIFSSY